MKKLFFVFLMACFSLANGKSTTPFVEETDGERSYVLTQTHDLPPFHKLDSLKCFATTLGSDHQENFELLRSIVKCPIPFMKTALMQNSMDSFLTIYDACNQKRASQFSAVAKKDMIQFRYFILDWLTQVQDLRVFFGNGYKGLYFSPHEIRKGTPGNHRADLNIIFYIKGKAKHKVSDPFNMDEFPEVFLSFKEKKNCPLYWHQVDWLNSKDQSKPRVMVCTSKGPVEENVLWVQKLADHYAIKLLSGTRCDAPFSILSEKTVPLDGNVLNDLKFNDRDNYFPLPETDADLNVLELLLEQFKQVEEKVAALQSKRVEEVSSDEEDTEVAAKHEDVKLTKAEERTIKKEARRVLKEQERKRLAEAKELEKKQRICDWEHEFVQKRAEEIIAQEDYEERTKQEQEAIVRRFDQGQGVKRQHHSQRGVGSGGAAPMPQQDKRWQKAEDQAKEELKGRRIKMNQVAKVLNQVFKIFPEMKNKLLPSSAERKKLAARQRGSHSVLPGSSPAEKGDDSLAPTTFVIPHGRSDLTIPKQRARNFVEAFVAFCAANSKTTEKDDGA